MPVAAVARIELFLVAKKDLPFRTFAEFRSYAKAHPGKLTYASPGNGTAPHIAAEMLKAQAGLFAVHAGWHVWISVLAALLIAVVIGTMAAYAVAPSARIADRLTRGRPAALQVPHRRGPVPVTTRALVRRAHAAGKHVHVWTVDDAGDMDRLLDLGVDGLMSDRADLLSRVLSRRAG